MALPSFSDANKSTSTALCVRYFVEYVDYSYYRVTRTATKAYSYVGMTKSAADSCAASKRALYTRNHIILDTVNTVPVGSTGRKMPGALAVYGCAAEISLNSYRGDTWNVDISVNETDIRCSATAPNDPASLFTSENARDYDEPSGPIEITSATLGQNGRIDIAFTSRIEAADLDLYVIHYKASPTAALWTVLTPDTSLTGHLVYTLQTAAVGHFVRVAYPPYVSAQATLQGA